MRFQKVRSHPKWSTSFKKFDQSKNVQPRSKKKKVNLDSIPAGRSSITLYDLIAAWMKGKPVGDIVRDAVHCDVHATRSCPHMLLHWKKNEKGERKEKQPNC